MPIYPNGTLEEINGECTLSENAVNEKIYLILWFWFALLLVLTFLMVISRFFIIVSPRIRAYVTLMRYRIIKKECVNIIMKHTKMGDWLLLYLIGQNINSIVFKDVMHDLAKKLGYHNKEEF